MLQLYTSSVTVPRYDSHNNAVQAVKQGTSDSKEACWAQFVLQCRNNLHVVLAMSPVGETLRTRCRNFPGLVNNTVIDWFEPWPEQALHSVATVFLQASMTANAACNPHLPLCGSSCGAHMWLAAPASTCFFWHC